MSLEQKVQIHVMSGIRRQAVGLSSAVANARPFADTKASNEICNPKTHSVMRFDPCSYRHECNYADFMSTFWIRSSLVYLTMQLMLASFDVIRDESHSKVSSNMDRIFDSLSDSIIVWPVAYNFDSFIARIVNPTLCVS